MKKIKTWWTKTGPEGVSIKDTFEAFIGWLFITGICFGLYFIAKGVQIQMGWQN